jgi:hypothetical protein
MSIFCVVIHLNDVSVRNAKEQQKNRNLKTIMTINLSLTYLKTENTSIVSFPVYAQSLELETKK